MFRKIKEALFGKSINERELEHEHKMAVLDELDSIWRNLDSLWSRMVQLEVERNAHDGTTECRGCSTEIQRHIDDLDIDVLVPNGLRALIREVLVEELEDCKNT